MEKILHHLNIPCKRGYSLTVANQGLQTHNSDACGDNGICQYPFKRSNLGTNCAKGMEMSHGVQFSVVSTKSKRMI